MKKQFTFSNVLLFTYFSYFIYLIQIGTTITFPLAIILIFLLLYNIGNSILKNYVKADPNDELQKNYLITIEKYNKIFTDKQLKLEMDILNLESKISHFNLNTKINESKNTPNNLKW
jgi:hypothetical protein